MPWVSELSIARALTLPDQIHPTRYNEYYRMILPKINILDKMRQMHSFLQFKTGFLNVCQFGKICNEILHIVKFMLLHTLDLCQ